MNVTDISQFNKSFSGTDTVAFIILPGCTPICIGSVTTVSYSVFRNKKPVLNLGRTNINGVTRGSRIYAGTIIFTLINQHWVRDLISQDACKSWLGDVKEIKADELPLFDIMLVSANEYGSYCSMFIYGIDLTDEAQTISIEDLFTENVFQFVARDLSTFKSGNATNLNESRVVSDSSRSINTKITGSRMYTMKNTGATESDINRYVKDKIATTISTKQEASRNRLTLPRALYESSTNTMIGNDVLSVQTLLNQKGYTTNINGIFDHDTSIAVKQYQVANGFTPNGVVDSRLYNSLASVSNKSGSNFKSLNGYVINKNGARELRYPNMNSDIIDIYPYKSTVEIKDIITDDNGIEYYVTQNGYILANDIFNSVKGHETTEIPKIDSNYSGIYVDLIKECLLKIYPEFKADVNNTYTERIETYIKRLQRENNRPVTGIVNEDTWLLLQHLSDNVNNINVQDDNSFKFSILPSEINVKKENINTFLTNDLRITVNPKNQINIKTVATSYNKKCKSFKTDSNLKLVNGNHILDFANFKNNFIYDPKNGSIPDKVELVMYPYDMQPYKWIINIV